MSISRLTVAIVCAACLGLARGADFEGRLLGDWGGLRNALAGSGLNLELSYTGEFDGSSSRSPIATARVFRSRRNSTPCLRSKRFTVKAAIRDWRGEALYDSAIALPRHLPLQPLQSNEYPLEAHYSANLSPAVVVRPNIRLIHAPGGVSGHSDVIIFGVHLGAEF